MKKSLVACALLGAFAFPSTSHADVPMDLIVVTGTRFASAVDDYPVNVTVITAEQIEKSAARTIPELLALQAGIQVRSNDGTPDMAVDIRGFGMAGNQNTLVLLDGQKQNDIELVSVRWSAIPLDSIERIEIVNGGGTVLYGAGASGGTINIITKRAGSSAGGNVSVGGGSYSTRETRASLQIRSERAALQVFANALDTANYRVNNRLIQSALEGDWRTEMEAANAGLQFGADRQSLRFPGPRRVDPTQGINQLESDRHGTSTPRDYGNRNGWHLSADATKAFDNGELAAELSYRNKNAIAYYDQGGYPSYLDSTLTMKSLTPRMKLNLGDATGRELITGVDMTDWDYHSVRASSAASVDTPTADILAQQSDRAVYVQMDSRVGANSRLTAGGRVQFNHFEARDAVNPAAYASGTLSRRVTAYEVGVRHSLADELSLFGKLGKSFRIATVDEIFDAYGGPSFDSKISLLEPQTSHDAQLGMQYTNAVGLMRATIYQMNLSDEIQYNALTFSNMNLSPTRRYGLELQGRRKIGTQLDLGLAYSYVVARFRSGSYNGVDVSGKNLPMVPRQNMSVSATWQQSDRMSVSGDLAYTGEQYFDNDLANTFGSKIAAYAVANLKMSYRVDQWNFAANMNNIFDRRYVSYAIASTSSPGVYNAYPMAERNMMFSATYAF